MADEFSNFTLRRLLRGCLRAAAFSCVLLAMLAWAGEATQTAEVGRVARNFQEARTRFEAEPSNAAPALAFSRACFELAEFATNSTQRAALAQQGIAAGRRALELIPTNAATQCYLGLNLGQLARTKTIGALKIVPQIEAAWLAAVELDPKFNHAGPHRLLALLYEGAPGWPLSIGSRSDSRAHFEKATGLAPDYADNWLCYLEACLGWNDLKTAQALLPKTGAAMAKARQLFTGPEWAWKTRDWEARWAAAQKKLEAALKRARSTTHQQKMKDY